MKRITTERKCDLWTTGAGDDDDQWAGRDHEKRDVKLWTLVLYSSPLQNSIIWSLEAGAINLHFYFRLGGIFYDAVQWCSAATWPHGVLANFDENKKIVKILSCWWYCEGCSTTRLHPWFLSSIHLEVSAGGNMKSKSYVYFAQNLHLRLRSNIGNMDLSCLLSGISGYKASSSVANYNIYLEDVYSILAIFKNVSSSMI